MNYQDALTKLKSLTDILQQGDIDHGFGQQTYLLEFYSYLRNYEAAQMLAAETDAEDPLENKESIDAYISQAASCLIDILTDAWNCKLISNSEYEELESALQFNFEDHINY